MAVNPALEHETTGCNPVIPFRHVKGLVYAQIGFKTVIP